MPARNGTGPMGMGPLTGRGMGFCVGAIAPETVNMAPGQAWGLRGGRGFRGQGGGGGRGWRNRVWATGLPGCRRVAVAPATREQQMDALKGQAANLEGLLGELRKQIEACEANKGGK